LLNQAKLGPAAARNLGIKEAKGEILFFLGDDVIAKPNLLEEHLRLHKNHNNCVVANPILPPSNANAFSIFTTLYFGDIKEETEYEINSRLGFCTACVSVCRTALKGELFDEEFKDAAYEDTELGIRLFKKRIKIVLTAKTDVCHDHIHNTQSIIKQAKNCGKASVYLRKKHPVRNVVLTDMDNGFKYNIKKFAYGILYKLFRKIYAKSTQMPLWYAKVMYQYNILLGVEEGRRLWLKKPKLKTAFGE